MNREFGQSYSDGLRKTHEHKAAERKARGLALQTDLARAQRALEAAPESITLQSDVKEATDRLGFFDKDKAAWVDQILQERWLEDGDRGSSSKHSRACRLQSIFLPSQQRMAKWFPLGIPWQI